MLSDSLALVVTHDCPPPSGIAKVTVGSGVGRGATEYPLEPIAIRFDGVDGATVSTMGGLRTTLKKISSVPRRVSVHTITASPGVMAIPVRSPRFAVRSRNRFFFELFEATVVMRRFSNEFPVKRLARNTSAASNVLLIRVS